MDKPLRDKKCPACTKAYLAMAPAQKHIRRKHPNCTDPVIILSPSEAAKFVKLSHCGQCSLVFNSKSARKQHVDAVHNVQCSICRTSLRKNRLARHMQKAHGTINFNAGRALNPTAPQFITNSAPVQSHPIWSSHASREVGESSRRTDISTSDSEDSADLGPHAMSLGRFYCQEYDCGKGFSSKAHLESHTRFFHPQKPAQATERVEGAIALSNDILDVDRKSTEHSPAYFSPASTPSPRHLGESAVQGSSGPAETHAPAIQRGRYQGAELDVGTGVQQRDEGFLDPPTTIRDGVRATSKVTASTPLSLRCMMCDASPTVGTRPTVTTCGHLFCSGCITRHVMSTSRCPVCDNALLLYCLFKLDLPAAF